MEFNNNCLILFYRNTSVLDEWNYRFEETKKNSYTLVIFVGITFYAITKKQLNSHVFHSFMSWLLLHLFEVKYCPNKNDFSITKQTHVLEASCYHIHYFKSYCHIPKKKTKQVLSNHRRNTLIICSNQSHRKILAWNVYYYYYFCTDSNQ